MRRPLSMLIVVAWIAVPRWAESGYQEILDGSSPPPPGWTLKDHARIDGDPSGRYQKTFGGQVASVTNSNFDYRGVVVQINLIEGKTEDDGDTIYATLLDMKGGNATYALRDEKIAIEIIAADYGAALRAPYDFGLRPLTARYRVRFDAAPLESADYMLWNDLYVACLKRSRAEDVSDTDARITQLAGSFDFGTTIWLRSQGLGAEPSRFELSPRPVRIEEAKGATRFELGELPARGGIPYVSVEAEVVCEAFAATPTDRQPDDAILGPTTHWPSDDPEIVTLAREIAGDAVTVEAKAWAVLDWLRPGVNFHYRGKTGARYGVKKALTQGHGHCWDFSDLFVTLCRALDVPARQVLGWWHDRGQGHVWAEVLLPDEGWVQVDATGATRCHNELIPLVCTETGDAPFVYVSEVLVEPLDGP